MDSKYNPQAIEAKWQKIWDEQKTFRASETDGRDPFYLLVMFPYPSGRIHMGHVRNYALGDVIARYQRMRGKNVLHPMGWDAFGMPAENAAAANNVHPKDWTYQNIAHMRDELKTMGLSYDWERELATCDQDYAHAEQALFLKLYEKGLVYRKKSVVNWDPVDHTVLANEQVIDGCGWRSGAPVERKELSQWFFRITDYADELLADLDKLGGWPETVRAMQANWIGKSHGVEFAFQLEGYDDTLPVYTTRPDTLMGVTFCSIAAEHPLAKALAATNPDAAAFIKECQAAGTSEEALETQEKRGFDTGIKAIHPVTGEKVPVFIANFVLMAYGTGAVMAVPAHDQRDFEFAKKYAIPIKVVIQPEGEALDAAALAEAYTGPGTLVNSGQFDGLDNETAKQKVAEYFEQRCIGKATVNFRLRDWGVSRQRYWGNPIPMVHCDACGVVPLPPEQLPAALPPDVSFDQPGNPLERHPTWKHIDCPKCGQPARRETDTMDTFMESSWYFLRYCSPDMGAEPLDLKRVNHWMPVDQYVGGIEHAVLHLLYSRFFHKALRDVGLVECDEPFTRLLTQGMVRKDTHKCPAHGWRYPREVKQDDEFLRCVECDSEIIVGRNEKMSKSKHNVVDPKELLDGYGADTARLFMLFAAPPDRDLEWSDSGVDGAWRFLNRVWRLVHALMQVAPGAKPASATPADADLKALRGQVHATIAKVTDDFERQSFNTGIAAIMELVNAIKIGDAPLAGEAAGVMREAVETVVKLLSPYAPHIAEELWRELGYADDLCNHAWPEADAEALVKDVITIILQVNGKLRDRLEVAPDIAKDELEKLALANDKAAAHIEGKTVRKVVVVPGRLVNIVAN
ncbi:leucine--tRNA ligase [Magnetofaba australis]|uniref:Leucine--tRNA ligase n=1 Tax=Magnetofaba australis IT-1 TaxID=1434232 RepID=A0A1Y2JZ11_9PROT|nr:leucine--tRNA ligase [Magnetofaba australis]OSM00140.1 putative leucyl-tRNA synthetase [Magnetofaba australis IT-1]